MLIANSITKSLCVLEVTGYYRLKALEFCWPGTLHIRDVHTHPFSLATSSPHPRSFLMAPLPCSLCTFSSLFSLSLDSASPNSKELACNSKVLLSSWFPWLNSFGECCLVQLWYREVIYSSLGIHWFKTRSRRGFPDGPLAKTPCSQCRGSMFNPWDPNRIQLKDSMRCNKNWHSQNIN